MITEFIKLIVLLNIWVVAGSWVFYLLLTDEELEEVSDYASLDVILWPAILFNVGLNRCMKRGGKEKTLDSLK